MRSIPGLKKHLAVCLLLIASIPMVSLHATPKEKESSPALSKEIEEINNKMAADTKKAVMKKHDLAPSKKKPDAVIIN